jgi:hypothetical protein
MDVIGVFEHILHHVHGGELLDEADRGLHHRYDLAAQKRVTLIRITAGSTGSGVSICCLNGVLNVVVSREKLRVVPSVRKSAS